MGSFHYLTSNTSPNRKILLNNCFCIQQWNIPSIMWKRSCFIYNLTSTKNFKILAIRMKSEANRYMRKKSSKLLRQRRKPIIKRKKTDLLPVYNYSFFLISSSNEFFISFYPFFYSKMIPYFNNKVFNSIARKNLLDYTKKQEFIAKIFISVITF